MSTRFSVPRAISRGLFILVALLTSIVMVTGGLSGVAWAEEPESDGSTKVGAKGTARDSDGDGDLDRPDTVSASSTARALKKRVEDLSKRTETTRTFANADGSFTDEQFGGVVRVQSDDDGTWKNVDYNLQASRGHRANFHANTMAGTVKFDMSGTKCCCAP